DPAAARHHLAAPAQLAGRLPRQGGQYHSRGLQRRRTLRALPGQRALPGLQPAGANPLAGRGAGRAALGHRRAAAWDRGATRRVPLLCRRRRERPYAAAQPLAGAGAAQAGNQRGRTDRDDYRRRPGRRCLEACAPEPAGLTEKGIARMGLVLSKTGEVADFLDADQFPWQNGKPLSQFMCGFFAVAICRAMAMVGKPPTQSVQQVIQEAIAWYVQYNGSDALSNTAGMSDG